MANPTAPKSDTGHVFTMKSGTTIAVPDRTGETANIPATLTGRSGGNSICVLLRRCWTM
jgi:hypothetical protein